MEVYILYYDGMINSNYDIYTDAYVWSTNHVNNFFEFVKVDAGKGYSQNMKTCEDALKFAKEQEKDLVILTNQVLLLNVLEAWNGEYHNIFLYRDGEFDLIKYLTEKDLRKEHNIMKLYIAGHFNI